MVYEEQLAQIQAARQQAAEQRTALTKQQQLLQNPNLLRRANMGYLLAPAGKPQRLQALQQIQSGLQQLSAFEAQLDPAEQKIHVATGEYEEAVRQYRLQQEQQARQERAWIPSSKMMELKGTAVPSFTESKTETVPVPVTPDKPVISVEAQAALERGRLGTEERGTSFTENITKVTGGTPTTYIPPSYIPGVKVLDIYEEKPKDGGKDAAAELYAALGLPPPTLNPIEFAFNLPPGTFTTPPAMSILPAPVPIPVGKPAEPPSISIQTGIQRLTELGQYIPPVQLYRTVQPYAQQGYDYAKPYIKEYVQENPLLQVVTLAAPLKAGKEEIQTFAQAYTPEIIKTADIVPLFRITGTSSVVPTFLGGAAELIPTTPLGVIGTVGGIKAVSALPAVGRIGVSGYFGVTGVETAVDDSLTQEQRAAGAIVGTLGLAGVTFESIPFARGVSARLSSEFAPTLEQPRGFKGVEIPEDVIGLILEKAPARTGETISVELPGISPLRRGGFGVRASEKDLFLGEQTVATSQQSFFEQNKNILLDREFFVTPAEPFIGIPETRISRLGLTKPFEFNLESEIGFGLPKQPQIGIERMAVVTRTGRGGTFEIGKGSELEAIKGAGTIIRDVERIARTSIRGQGVDIFEFTTTKSPFRETILREPTTRITRRVSGESVLSTTFGLATSPVSVENQLTSQLTSSEKSVSSITGGTSDISGGTTPMSTISPPTSEPPSSFRISGITYPVYPPVTPPSVPTTTISYPPFYPREGKITAKGISKKKKVKGRRTTAYSVLLKRRGAFIPVARGLPRGRALKFGAESVQKELSRQFKIVKAGTTEVEDIAFRPREKEFRAYKVRRGKRVVTPDQFIQRISNALSSSAEKQSIRQARAMKQVR